MNTPAQDIRKESILCRNRNFSKGKQSASNGKILVTGANSFIGCHIIRKLQDKYPDKIDLLLRAPSEQDHVLET